MDPIEIIDEARYQVTLAAPVPHGDRKLLPRDRHRMAGATLRQITTEHGWEGIAHVERIV